MFVNIRALAAQCTFAVVDQGKSLTEELPKQQAKVTPKDKGLLQELCYGVLRYLPELEFDARQLMDKPLTGKQRLLHFLILVGIYQFKYTRIPDHAAVAETVNAAQALKNKHLKGLINGVLRNFQRSYQKPTDNMPKAQPDAIKYNHPSWFIKKIQAGYPEHWQNILAANQQKPPMWLRVNQQHISIADYIKRLEQVEINIATVDDFSGAIQLEQARDVTTLPKFEQGFVSIQDGAAQQAAILLDCKAGDNVLDCCAAPGGKTCHILERYPDIAQLTAIDIEAQRLLRVSENLTRLNLTANVVAGNAAKPETWWDNILFDRILLDAPCSGTGVIRRHPDIKWLRKSSDIDTLTQLQQQILTKIWDLLKPGGILLYTTCSILPEENKNQIQQFLSDNTNAELLPIEQTALNTTAIGWQILPNENNMDGFYYAKLKKKSI